MNVKDLMLAKAILGGGGGGSSNTIETIETTLDMHGVFSKDDETVDLIREIESNNVTIYIDTVYNNVPARLSVASANGTTVPYKIIFTGAVFSEEVGYTNTLSLYLATELKKFFNRYVYSQTCKVSALGTVSDLPLTTPATVTIIRHPLG